MTQNNLPEILISISPRWCDKIAHGLKTLEIRKTKPKYNGKFKCYIYQTKESERLWGYMEKGECKFTESSGKVIGEFICDCIYNLEGEFHNDTEVYQNIMLHRFDEDGIGYGNVVTSNDSDNPNHNWLCERSYMRFDEIRKYINKEGYTTFYAWSISELKIYDKPIELSEFVKVSSDRDISCKYREKNYNARSGKSYYKCLAQNCICEFTRLSRMTDCDAFECRKEKGILKRAPQSWCYVEKVVK